MSVMAMAVSENIESIQVVVVWLVVNIIIEQTLINVHFICLIYSDSE